jgi:hypothetical protein
MCIQVAIISLMIAGCTNEEAKTTDDWIPLLRDNNMVGWYTFIQDYGRDNDPEGIFSLKNGVLHFYPNSQNNSHQPFGYMATEKEYSNYHLRLQYKWGTKKFAPREKSPHDSGLLYHVIEADRVWPTCVECQIMEGDGGSIYAVRTTVTTTVDTGGAFLKAEDGGIKRTFDGPGIKQVKMDRDDESQVWNTVEVIIQGDSAVHMINGKVNNRCTKMSRPDPENPDKLIPLIKGRIALQAEGAEIFIRNIEIKILTGRTE